MHAIIALRGAAAAVLKVKALQATAVKMGVHCMHWWCWWVGSAHAPPSFYSALLLPLPPKTTPVSSSLPGLIREVPLTQNAPSTQSKISKY